jgi:hypothetical protein
VVNFLLTSLYTNSSIFVPLYIKSQYDSSLHSSSGPKFVTFTDIAKTLKNLGADFYSAKSSLSRKSPTLSHSSGSGGAFIRSGLTRSLALVKSNNPPKREDKRLLIPIKPYALLNRLEPFAL